MHEVCPPCRAFAGLLRGTLPGTATLLLAPAVCCGIVLAPRHTSAAQIEQLRQQWRRKVEGRTSGVAVQNIAESLLHGTQVTASSPVDVSFREANSRGLWFGVAMYLLMASLTAMAAVVIQVFWQL